jgi:hypothetical protein
VTAATGVTGTRAGSSAAPTRYSVAGGCYEVLRSGRSIAPDAGPFTLQAAALGRYLLYGVHRDFVADGGSGAIAPAPKPSPDAEWTLDGDAAHGFMLTNAGTGTWLTDISLRPTTGCAAFPEAEIGSTGNTFKGAGPSGEVNGTIDAHTHVTAFEFIGGDFHCGRSWHPYGISYALPDCAPINQGVNRAFQDFVDYGAPVKPHDTRGWPTFRDWPGPQRLAEEGDYYTGVKRAWQAGLRVFVTQLVDNEALCSLMTIRHNPCNDMAGVHIQARALRDLQDYIDAQSGGPGKGFFRIVTDPFQARRVINAGKLAVVEGIEVSRIFGCGEHFGVPECDRAKVDAGLKEIRDLGVRTFFPVHKFDNAFGGTKMDSGETGAVVNAGNHLETGQFWDVKTCTGHEHDNPQLTAPVDGLTQLLNGPLHPLLPTGALPVYPPTPHCNTRGLTSLGSYLIEQMIRQHLIVELDHMDALTADQALAIIQAHRYSGVISAHSWDSPEENVGIYNVGGFVTPGAGSSPTAFVAEWRADSKIRDPRYYAGTGFGYGADMNGLATQAQPTNAHPIPYPFKSFDGRVTFARERWGKRVFDLNTDGLANYGMYPDWLQELQVLAGRPIVADMFRGAEAYLQMWERASGVPATTCRPASERFSPAGLGAIRLGMASARLLLGAGQPSARPGNVYSYCVAGSGNAGASVKAVFTRRGTVGLVVSTAAGDRAGAISAGVPAALLGTTRAWSGGTAVWVGPSLRGGARYIYGVAGGRVRYVAVLASRAIGARAGTLRGYLRAAGVA